MEEQELLNIMSMCLYFCLSYSTCTHIFYASHYIVICGLSGSSV